MRNCVLMKKRWGYWVGLVAIAGGLFGVALAADEPLRVVAAENFYGGVAQEVLPDAKVTSILSNPNQDPHSFQTDAATAKEVAEADIVIYSGLGYDSWMDRLLQVDGKKDRKVIVVADLIGAKDGANPHIWYNPETMPTLVKRLGELGASAEQIAAFDKSMQPLREKIASLREKTNGMKVTATEPVFGYMATALGFDMLNADYQLAVMNDAEPSFAETAAFEKSLQTKEAKLLFYNSQVTDPSTERMQSIAKTNGVPVIGVTETQPPNADSYVDWMLYELNALGKALP